MEWLNETSHCHYPLEYNIDLATDIILDACLFLNEDAYLTSIEPLTTSISLMTINKHYLFYYDTSLLYAFNDFGKIVIGNINTITSKKIFNIKFLDSVIYPKSKLYLMDDQGDIILTGVDSEFGISLPTTNSFTYNCIESINGVFPPKGNAVIEHDTCTNIINFTDSIVLNDICLPPCYNCDERLETGDVKQYLTSLEDRVTELEQHQEHPIITKTIELPYTDVTTSLTFPTANTDILKSVTVRVDTPGSKLMTVGSYFTDIPLNVSGMQKYYSYAQCATETVTITMTPDSGIGKIFIEILYTS